MKLKMLLIAAFAIACGSTDPDRKGSVGRVQDGEDSGGGAAGSDPGVRNQPPSIELLEPEAGAIPYADDIVVWQVQVDDAEDPLQSLQIEWTSDLQGELSDLPTRADSSGIALGEQALIEGSHLVVARVTDSDGATAKATVTLDVGPSNSAPECAFLVPTVGEVLPVEETVTIQAEVGDVNQTVDSLSVVLSSDVDGELFRGAADSSGLFALNDVMLSVGSHLLSLEISDDRDAVGVCSVEIRMGHRPVVQIANPVDGDVINQGEDISLLGTVTDIDSPVTDVVATWSSSLDGLLASEAVSADSTSRFTWSNAAAGVHVVGLSAEDPDGLQAEDAIEITINVAPTEPTVRIDPDPPVTSDDLVATVTGSVDPDGVGTLVLEYVWTRDGAVWTAATGDTVPSSATAKHQTWEVTVTPSDGYATGPSASDSVTVLNSDPVLGTPTISPSAGIEAGDTATCSATASDIDGDTVSLSYVWTDASGGTLGTGSTYTLPDGTVTPGSSIICTVTADDGDGGTATASALATVVNSAPTILSVVISPDVGVVAGETLTCTAVATDPDGDAVSISYEWQNLTTMAAATSGQTYAVIGGTDSPDDVLQCTATATDARGASATGTDSVIVENTDPVVTVVNITPTGPYNDSTVTCLATVTDADMSSVSIAYSWSGPSGVIAAGATLALHSSMVSPNDALVCEATASDPHGGIGSGSSTAVVANRLPGIAGVTLSPDPAYIGDTLTCAVTGTFDDDGDTVTVDYQWWTGTTMLTSGSDTWLVSVPAGTVVTCRTVPSDGHSTGTTVSTQLSIENSAPTITSLGLSPSSLYTDEVVTAAVTADDVDGDPIYLSYEWTVSGATVTGASGASLDGTTNFDKGDTVAVTVTPRGPTRTGVAVTSASITVLNTPPEAPSVVTSPTYPSVTDDIVCEVQSPSFDLDRDTVSYSATWVDASGSSPATTSTTVFSGDTLPASATTSGDVWTCTVTPNDGDDDGATASVTVSLGCDEDGDGVASIACGGYDCDDDDSSVYPAAGDTYGDGLDTDCDGMDCEADDDGVSYYTVCPDEVMTWAEAEAACQAGNYDGLVSLESAAEMTFVEALLSASGATHSAAPWIGLYESGGEGSWIWASGASVVITDWASGQPDDGTTAGEDCAQLNWPYGSMQWNDVACDGASSGMTVVGLSCERVF